VASPIKAIAAGIRLVGGLHKIRVDAPTVLVLCPEETIALADHLHNLAVEASAEDRKRSRP